jgi:hypothetical protein
MAFTAGSVELAKANKLGNMLAHLFSAHGLSGAAGRTGALLIEKTAKKLGFGITGITNGAGFPPFGSINPSLLSGTEAALQNPRGETMINNIALGAIEGQTVGIYLKKFVRNGADYQSTMFSGLTLYANTTAGGNTFSINGLFNAFTNDSVVIGGNIYKITSGFTSSVAGLKSEISVSPVIGNTFIAAATTLNIQTVGLTRGTVGVVGTTFENFQSKGIVNGGFTASVYFTNPIGGSGWWVVS